MTDRDLWRYEFEDDSDEETCKRTHVAVSGFLRQRVYLDFSPYQRMTDETFDLFVELGFPRRVNGGALTLEDLREMKNARG